MVSISIEFKNVQQLYGSYMPFVNHGGLFFISQERVELGQMIQVSVMLPDDLEPTEFEGSVIWINPLGAQGGRPVGFGVSLNENQIKLRSEIEKLLGAKLSGADVTSTM